MGTELHIWSLLHVVKEISQSQWLEHLLCDRGVGSRFFPQRFTLFTLLLQDQLKTVYQNYFQPSTSLTTKPDIIEIDICKTYIYNVQYSNESCPMFWKSLDSYNYWYVSWRYFWLSVNICRIWGILRRLVHVHTLMISPTLNTEISIYTVTIPKVKSFLGTLSVWQSHLVIFVMSYKFVEVNVGETVSVIISQYTTNFSPL